MRTRRGPFITGTLALIAGAGGWLQLAPQHPSVAGSATLLPPLAAVSTRQSGNESPLPPTARAGNSSASTIVTTQQTSAETAARLSAEICAAFNSLSIERLDFALTQLLPALVREDAPAAARLAESLTEPNLRSEVMYLVARLWGKKDAESALTWAGELKIEYEREAALTDAGADLARENPARALELSARSFRADEPSPVLENLVQQWAEKNLPAALAWTFAHSAGPQRDELLARLVLVEARRDPPAAAQLVVNEMRPGETQNEAAVSVLHQWAQRNLPDALAWAERFPESPLRDRAIAEVNSTAKFRLAAAR